MIVIEIENCSSSYSYLHFMVSCCVSFYMTRFGGNSIVFYLITEQFFSIEFFCDLCMSDMHAFDFEKLLLVLTRVSNTNNNNRLTNHKIFEIYRKITILQFVFFFSNDEACSQKLLDHFKNVPLI